MDTNGSRKPVFSDVHVFYAIAKESYESMRLLMEAGRRPMPDGGPGYIKTMDPDRKSFKAALIAIVFAGVFLESLLHLLIVERKSLNDFKRYDRKPYEEKLKYLGCIDPEIMELCQSLRGARREIVHEKAHLDNYSLRVAQNEAEKAMILIDKVIAHFNLKIGK